MEAFKESLCKDQLIVVELLQGLVNDTSDTATKDTLKTVLKHAESVMLKITKKSEPIPDAEAIKLVQIEAISVEEMGKKLTTDDVRLLLKHYRMKVVKVATASKTRTSPVCTIYIYVIYIYINKFI